jgi:hypothetical protein
MKFLNFYVPSPLEGVASSKDKSSPSGFPAHAIEMKTCKDRESLPFGVSSSAKYNRNYIKILKELGIDMMTNEEIENLLLPASSREGRRGTTKLIEAPRMQSGFEKEETKDTQILYRLLLSKWSISSL